MRARDVVQAARTRVRRGPAAARAPRTPRAPRPPRVRLALVLPVPGAAVRLAPAALVVLCAVLVAPRSGTAVLVALLAAGAAAWRPRWPVPAGVTVLVAGGVLLGEDLLAAGPSGAPSGAGLGRLAVLSVALHLLVRLAALAGHVPWRGVVEAGVLLRAVRPVLGVQAVVLALGAATAWLRWGLGGTTSGSAVLQVVAVVAAVLAAVLVLPRAWLARRPPEA